MGTKRQGAAVLFMLGVMALVIVLVDDRWVRAGLWLLPALLIARGALSVAGEPARTGATERRKDPEVRRHIDELLKLFREFYTTCHLMTAGHIDSDEAKALAEGIEGRLDELLTDVTESGRAQAADS